MMLLVLKLAKLLLLPVLIRHLDTGEQHNSGAARSQTLHVTIHYATVVTRKRQRQSSIFTAQHH